MDCLKCLPIIVTTIITLFGVYIAYQQYKLGREKFKLDLFEKRFAVFSSARRVLSIVSSSAKVELNELFDFRANTAESIFLFGDEISDYLRELEKRMIRTRKIQKELAKLPVGEERYKLAKQEEEELNWLMDQMQVLPKRFSHYLKFTDLQKTLIDWQGISRRE